MKTFQDFLNTIEDPEKKGKMEAILNHIREKYPQLQEEIKWHQPMFSDHGTFIMGFSLAKNNIALGPEAVVIKHFEKDIEKAGYTHTTNLIRIKWTDEVDYDLIDKMVEYNIEDKKNMTKYWR